MQSVTQCIAIHGNLSADKDVTKVSETAMSDHALYDTINPQPQQQSVSIHVNPSASDEDVKTIGIPNPMYNAQVRATENPYSFDTCTENAPTHCTADYVQ